MVVDHSTIYNNMEEIAISKFKATCLAVLENVRKTGKTVLVTRFGEPVAEVVPPHASRKGKHWVGSLAGTGLPNHRPVERHLRLYPTMATEVPDSTGFATSS